MRTITYVVPSPFLYQASKQLQPPEKIVFGSGVRLMNSLVVLTELIPIKCKSSSRVHGHPDPADLDEKHWAILGLGMDFEFQFHSHPGKDAEATSPSGTDLATVRRWEKHGPFIGAVFSEGGRYVRFFNVAQRSVIHVYGNKVNQLDEGLFELPEIDAPESEAEALKGPDEGTDGQAGVVGVVEPTEGGWRQRVRDWKRRLGRSGSKDAGPDGD